MSAPFIDSSNRNTLWCSVLVETLFLRGVRSAVVSPGSRSTPLTIAFARHPGVEALPVLDERSAGFFALGIAKASGRPVVLVCTSGTAAANYLPAVIEAQESAVPLIVMTADRPPELRACSSGQTIDQLKLYGDHVQFFHEFAVPEPSERLLAYARQMVSHAFDRSLVPQPGPVHLNCPFRDPLHPIHEERGDRSWPELGEAFFSGLPEVAPSPQTASVAAVSQWKPGISGLVVAGDCGEFSGDAARTVRDLAALLGWPLLADVLSPVRHYTAESTACVAHYDAILRSPAASERLKPSEVLVIGALPTSKVLRGWLEQLKVPMLFVGSGSKNRDALHARSAAWNGSPADLLAHLRSCQGLPQTVSPLLVSWQRAESAARACLEKSLAAENSLVEPKAAWLLGELLPAGVFCFVANSMPVRDLEYLWSASDRGTRMFFNRGANGIDGTLSTALGVAQGGGELVLLCGDLSFLHDSNALLLARCIRGSLTLVLINNGGGGIFGHLPVARCEDVFERYFATPQKVDFAKLLEAHGLEHHLIEDWADYRAQLALRAKPGSLRVLELRTDRKADAAHRKRLFGQAAEAAAAALNESSP